MPDAPEIPIQHQQGIPARRPGRRSRVRGVQPPIYQIPIGKRAITRPPQTLAVRGWARGFVPPYVAPDPLPIGQRRQMRPARRSAVRGWVVGSIPPVFPPDPLPVGDVRIARPAAHRAVRGWVHGVTPPIIPPEPMPQGRIKIAKPAARRAVRGWATFLIPPPIPPQAVPIGQSLMSRVAAPAQIPRRSDIYRFGTRLTVLPPLPPIPPGTITFEDQPPPNRYYPTVAPTRVRVDEPLRGEWASKSFSGWAWAPTHWTYRALQDKTGQALGPIGGFAINQRDNYDYEVFRWLLGPFEAGALDTLFDLCFDGRVLFQTGVGLVASSIVQYKLHIYITQGESATVREVLLDNYTDPDAFNPQVLRKWQNLTTAQHLVGTLEDGDGIMIEVGFRIVSSPPTLPATYPPSVYTDIAVRFTGCSVAASDAFPELLADDAHSPWFQFSQTLIPKAASARPANDTCANAIAIPSLPYTSPGIDTTAAISAQRDIFFTWTAGPGDAGRRVYFTGFQSNYNVVVGVFRNGCTQTQSPNGFVNSSAMAVHRSQAVYSFEAEANHTFLIRLRNVTTNNNAPGAGGIAYLQGWYQDDPIADDLYLPCNGLPVYRGAQLVNFSLTLTSFTPTGIAFDYTQRPVTRNFPDPHVPLVNTTYRLLIGLYGFALVEIFDPYLFGTGGEEIDYIGDPFGGIDSSPAQLHVTAAGMLTTGWFGNGFLFVASIISGLPAYLNAPSDDPLLSAFRTIDATHGDNQTGAPFSSVVQVPAVEVTAPWCVTVDELNNIAYYTSGSEYIAVGGQQIRRYDLSAGVDLGVWVTLPVRSTFVPSVRGLQYIGGGQVLACNGDVVYRLDSGGNILQTYTPSVPAETHMLQDVKLTADGTAFWVVDLATVRLCKFDLASGVELLTFPTWLTPGSLVQMAIFQPGGHVIPPLPGGEACPIVFPIGPGGGHACVINFSLSR